MGSDVIVAARINRKDVDETVVADLYLLGSVGTGCEISKLWKGVLT